MNNHVIPCLESKVTASMDPVSAEYQWVKFTHFYFFNFLLQFSNCFTILLKRGLHCGAPALLLVRCVRVLQLH